MIAAATPCVPDRGSKKIHISHAAHDKPTTSAIPDAGLRDYDHCENLQSTVVVTISADVCFIKMHEGYQRGDSDYVRLYYRLCDGKHHI